MAISFKIKQLKSLWAFFRSTLLFGLMTATKKEQASRMYKCFTCPLIRATKKGEPCCGICGCRVSWRIKPTASFCPDSPRRWDAKRRDFFFSEWLRNRFYKNIK